MKSGRLIKCGTALILLALAINSASGMSPEQSFEATIGEENETKMVHVDDIDIAYKTFGEGDPLLMIMGSSGTMDLWPPELLSELASHNQVIIFDNRGMGKTTASDKEFTMELFANDTAGLLDALNISRAHVLGWSMGTFIAQELVLNYPDKVDKVILYAADCGGNEAISPST